MNKSDAVQWLNNRGHMVEKSEIIKCKSVGKYLFILQEDCPHEVELYNKNDMYGECIDGFPLQFFSWKKDDLRKYITKEIII
jgi:hypothetical protein|tara:strand:+ start:254 stop:499 length:246 start_codon:yes stop_codon:yes gene_type:complete